MAPAPIDPRIVDVAPPKKDTLELPEPARERFEKAGIDLSNGYPYRPSRPLYLDDVYNVRNEDRLHVDPGSRADPEKKALLSAAKEVIPLTRHIGTEIVGLQLKDLTDQQKDELGLLIAERSVVFFRDQDISPQQQKELGEYFGEVEVHVSSIQSVVSLNHRRYGFCPATRTPSPRCPRRNSPLASIIRRRAESKLPPARRRISLAQRSRTRETTRRSDTPAQRHRPNRRRRHPLGEWLRSI